MIASGGGGASSGMTASGGGGASSSMIASGGGGASSGMTASGGGGASSSMVTSGGGAGRMISKVDNSSPIKDAMKNAAPKIKTGSSEWLEM